MNGMLVLVLNWGWEYTILGVAWKYFLLALSSEIIWNSLEERCNGVQDSTVVDRYISGACAQIKYMHRTWRGHFFLERELRSILLDLCSGTYGYVRFDSVIEVLVQSVS